MYFFHSCFALKTISSVATIFAIILLICVVFIPETPYWYLLRKQRENAFKSLVWLRGLNLDRIEIEIREIENNLDKTDKSLSIMQTISNIRWWKYFLKFSTYIVLLEFSGYGVFFMYTLQIITEINRTGIKNNTIGTLFSVVSFVILMWSATLVEKFKRKNIIICFNFINLLLLLAIAFCEFYSQSLFSSIISLISASIFEATVTITGCILSWIIISENLPTELRATVHAFLCAEGYIWYFFIIKFYPIIRTFVSLSYVMISFAFVSVLNVIWIYFCVKETRGIILPGNKNIEH